MNSTINNNNNSTTSSLNDTLVCHPILLANGNKSEVGLCDDEVSAIVIAAIVLAAHILLLLISLSGFIYKLIQLKKLSTTNHSNQRLEKVNFLTVARNPALMILGALAGFIYNVVISGRILIGRKIYPCFIFSLIYYLCVPTLASTIILRFIRLIVLSWLNNVKVRIAKREMILPNVIFKNKDIPMIEVTSSSNEATQPSDGQSTSENNKGMNVSASYQSIASHSEVSLSSASTSALVPPVKENLTTDSNTQNQATTIAIHHEHDDEEEIILKKDTFLESFEKGRLLELLKFLVSSKFIYLVYGVVCFIHISIYLIIGGVDYYNFTNGIKNSNKRQAFVIDTFLFSPSGCGTGSYNTTLFITYLGVYAAIGVVFAIIALFMKKDIWFVKMEIIFTMVNWIFFALLYGIPSLFTQVTTLVDYYVPVANTIEIACMVDTFISITLPVFVYQKIDKKKNESSSNLPMEPSASNSQQPADHSNHIRKILTNEKWNSLFLQFSEKCFASEDILMWHAVEQYKKVTSDKLRIELFLKICDTYLRIGAPLELNIPRKEFGIPEIMELYMSLRSSRQLSARSPSNRSPARSPMKDLTPSVPPSNTISNLTPKIGNLSNAMATTNSGIQPVNPVSMNAFTSGEHHATTTNAILSPSVSTPAFSISSEIFNRVQICCEHNMLDNFTRFELVYDLKNSVELGFKK
ncbi:hypothetical protein C9374_002445 [Naegleria lovaniensis]|uniref:RGS domain-containing protein n=1 Tax=Naegleria lovaniensis TaxID=51637 RepID=A0AA88GQT8_NAELO|nr:uncharacterized protein C9374_002445 [Naegleria lovaniensis]KAG2386701.1 hypothetical protein C9374_002445 [Naegleria lovaniensis]